MLFRAVKILALSTLAFGGVSRASLLYNFNVDVTGMDPFSFSFTVPNFVSDGESPAFTPFSITDGTHTWTMINDLTTFNFSRASGCFMFDSGGNSFFLPPCGEGAAAPDGALELDLSPGVLYPTEPGVYALTGGGLFGVAGQGTLIPSAVGTLDIESVPEPRVNIVLLSFAVVILGWKLRERLARA